MNEGFSQIVGVGKSNEARQSPKRLNSTVNLLTVQSRDENTYTVKEVVVRNR